MNNDLFVFRVDSSSKIGIGHVMRCLALANEIREMGGLCLFISRPLNGNINKLIKKKNFELLELKKPVRKINNILRGSNHPNYASVSWEEDAKETINILSKMNIRWLIIDHYSLCSLWENELSGHVSNILVIDDIGDRAHQCNILLDQNLDANKLKYQHLIPKKCKALLGPKYALLRPEFKEKRHKSLEKRKGRKLKRILLNFGGSDSKDFVKKVLSAIAKHKLRPDISIYIISNKFSGNENPYVKLIDRIHNSIKCFAIVDNLAEILLDIDLVVGAAGSSSWERCCLGVPSIVFSIAENQNEIAKSLSQAGAAIYMSEINLKDGSFVKKLDELAEPNGILSCMSEKALNIVDGNGIKRIVKKLNT
jgi:UDP-2,4-diacetamido-2,4,6-trideoxy-beta-L-altropyranose hydrolase